MAHYSDNIGSRTRTRLGQENRRRTHPGLICSRASSPLPPPLLPPPPPHFYPREPSTCDSRSLC